MEYNSLKDCSILVVDDEVELCELVVEEFKKTGAQVTMATSGFEGIQRVLNKNFDIVFTDIRMSNGDGYFLAKEIQKLNLTNLFVFFYSVYKWVYPGLFCLLSSFSHHISITN